MRNFKFQISNLRFRKTTAPRFHRAAVSRLLLTAFCLLLTAFCLSPSSHAAWSKQRTGSFAWLHSVFFVGGGRGWAVGGSGVQLETRDGGEHWEARRPPVEDALKDVFFTDAQTGWIVGAGATVLYTSDGGTTWRAGTVNGSLAQFALRAATRAREQDGASSDSTPTASKPTVESQASLRVNAVSFVDARRGWAVGVGGLVLATVDGGRTWRTEESGTESDLFDVKFFDEREGWAVGGEGVAIHTADGGATWHAEATGTPHTLERLFFSERTRGWAVGFGGTIIAFKG